MRGAYGSFILVSAAVFTAAGTMVTHIADPAAMLARAAASARTGGAFSTFDHEAPAVTHAAPVSPPVAARIEHMVTAPFGTARPDPYYWLNRKDDPAVVAHLNAENAWAEAQLAPLKPLQDALYAELEARANLPDEDAPYSRDGYYYQTRYAAGADYPVITRRKGAPDGPEELLLDVPALARGYAQYFLRGWEVSPDGSKVAFAVDFKGDRVTEIFLRDLLTGAVSSTGIGDGDGAIAWAPDGASFLYGRVDETVRTNQIKRHRVGDAATGDAVLFQEDDATFSLSVNAAKSHVMAIVTVYHLQRTELLAVDLTRPDAQPVMLVPRTRNVRAFADHMDGAFYVLTNDGAPDRKIVAMPDGAPRLETARVIVPETPGRYIDDFALFRDYVAIQETHDATTSVRAFTRDGRPAAAMPDFGPLGATALEANFDPSLTTLRVTFESATTPPALHEVDMMTGETHTLKRNPAWTWFDPALYEARRIETPARDGAMVPVTLMWRKDRKAEGGNPTLVYGYGAYGHESAPGFYRNFVSLADRGFVIAIAHVRGGRDRGEAWYAQGRMANKMNSFTDFIAASEAVVAQGVARPDRLYAMGGSAGGLLVGAVMNMRPDLYDGVVAQVPFVDVLTTMLDDTIPLTTFEYEEWGNPGVPEQYHWIAAYSPYDNVRAQNYPALFVQTGLNDSQVGYFEPAKWVAKLRATKTDAEPLLFLCNMGAGHGGNSGRTGPVAERAKTYAWLLDRAGR